MDFVSPAVSPARLLDWYDRHRRILPWRAPPGQSADPYRVWLSEVMLQQTTVAAVAPRYERFLARFPTVHALAAAPSAAVMEEWAGLGYYARARNLHACAQAVAAGGWPVTPEGLRALPGIGAYTATALGAIAFGWPGVPVDGNVERVCARLGAVEEPFPAGKRAAAHVAAALGDDPAAVARPSDFAQALFDLGATICTPRAPACALCPWRDGCRALAAGIAAELPRKAAKAARPERIGDAFVLADAENRVLLRRRPPRGLLGGMPELPGSEWAGAAPAWAPPVGTDWVARGTIRHVFTHFELTLRVWRADVAAIEVPPGYWLVPAAGLGTAGLPTVMVKAWRLAALV